MPNILNKNRQQTPQDKDRLLMEYAGIFKGSVAEFAEKVIKKTRKVKNKAR